MILCVRFGGIVTVADEAQAWSECRYARAIIQRFVRTSHVNTS